MKLNIGDMIKIIHPEKPEKLETKEISKESANENISEKLEKPQKPENKNKFGKCPNCGHKSVKETGELYRVGDVRKCNCDIKRRKGKGIDVDDAHPFRSVDGKCNCIWRIP